MMVRALCCLALATFAAAAEAPDGIVTTHHQAAVAGKGLRYTARAGLLPIRDNEAAELHAGMFFVAYSLDRAPGATPRPLTFAWNGGPGSNAGLVHLLGFGPKRVALATGSMPRLSPAGTALVDNQETWLTGTDLVFVDPVGTGYSRPAKAEYATEFYQSRGDAESVAEFIRVYRTRYDAFDAPLYLLGESYGVTRCALVAEALERRRTRVTGVVMLSGGFPLGDMNADLRTALYLPTLTAAAWYQKKLPAGLMAASLQHALRPAEEYAKTEYAAALAGRDKLTDSQRDAVIAQLARFSGMPAAKIDRAKLTVPIEQFSVGLLADQKLVVGRYDSRLTGPIDPSPIYDPTTDPSLKDILDGISVIRYLRNVIGYKSDLFYQGPFGGGYPPPTAFRGDWMSVKWSRNAKAAGQQPVPAEMFTKAMKDNPKLRVLVASGYYDLVSNYLAIIQAASQLPPDIAARVTVKTYGGGHATYTDDAARREFRADALKFYQEAK